jgi:hypothetical protein
MSMIRPDLSDPHPSLLSLCRAGQANAQGKTACLLKKTTARMVVHG